MNFESLNQRKTPQEEVVVKVLAAYHISKRRRNAKRVALFFKGDHLGRNSIRHYDGFDRPAWGPDFSGNGAMK